MFKDNGGEVNVAITTTANPRPLTDFRPLLSIIGGAPYDRRDRNYWTDSTYETTDSIVHELSEYGAKFELEVIDDGASQVEVNCLTIGAGFYWRAK